VPGHLDDKKLPVGTRRCGHHQPESAHREWWRLPWGARRVRHGNTHAAAVAIAMCSWRDRT
jgi:hypothetical protein